jgi:hypothetical protein
MAEQAFPPEVVQEMIKVYDRRRGGMENVDREAVQRILDRFPEKTEDEKRWLTVWAAMATR